MYCTGLQDCHTLDYSPRAAILPTLRPPMKNQRSVEASARAYRSRSARKLRTATVTGLLMAAAAVPVMATPGTASATRG